MAHCFDRNNKEQKLKGLEVFEITPVIFGGSSTDPKNKTMLTRKQHIEACRYWNKMINDSKRGKPYTRRSEER